MCYRPLHPRKTFPIQGVLPPPRLAGSPSAPIPGDGGHLQQPAGKGAEGTFIKTPFLCQQLVDRKSGLSTSWVWQQRAHAVGMAEHYEFFYRYSSRLLHAEPVSFATHQPLLETYEIIALLDHVLASILDAVELAHKLLLLFPRLSERKPKRQWRRRRKKKQAKQ